MEEQVASLLPARAVLWDAALPLYEMKAAQTGAADPPVPPGGAFYFMPPLPPGASEEAAVSWLAREHQLLLLPGSAFGAPGTLRLSYGCLADATAAEAVADRLQRAVAQLLAAGEVPSSCRS